MQTRHNFVGGIRIFFCENLYQSFIDASVYHETFHHDLYHDEVWKKSRHRLIKIDNQWQRLGATPERELKIDFVEIGALRHVARQSDHASDRLGQSHSTGDEISCFLCGNLVEKASCVNDRTFVSLRILENLFFSNLPQIRIT